MGSIGITCCLSEKDGNLAKKPAQAAQIPATMAKVIGNVFELIIQIKRKEISGDLILTDRL